jgi:hypothetical protein
MHISEMDVSCRICYDGPCDSDVLLSQVCACKGTIGYIHRSCLMRCHSVCTICHVRITMNGALIHDGRRKHDAKWRFIPLVQMLHTTLIFGLGISCGYYAFGWRLPNPTWLSLENVVSHMARWSVSLVSLVSLVGLVGQSRWSVSLVSLGDADSSFMHPKRRFWKDDQKMKCWISKPFSRVWVRRRQLAPFLERISYGLG